MAFYFQPVSGNISLKKLEIFAVNRLRFLIQTNQLSDNRLQLLDLVNNLHSVAESECLIEGSQKDNISHFTLRLLLVDEESQEFFVRAESLLFKFRFSCLTENEIYKTLKSCQKHLSLCKVQMPSCYDFKNIHHVLSTFQALKHSAGSWKNVAQCYVHNRSRKQFQVPFQAVTSLVARRRVEMHKGWALVSFDDLEEVLTGLFQSALKLSLGQIEEKQEMALGDSRMKRLSQKLKMIHRREVPKQLKWNDLPCLSHDQVDQSEGLFPLCMSNLHRNLRNSHRLKHNDRIQYSLFLKEAGMPVHQALTFWSREYSQPGLIPDCHSWQSDAPRYLYNIRHLYGLEGARRNYRGHCCSSLQRRQLGPFEQGGCPFVHFDDGSLGNLLSANQIGEEERTKLLRLRREGLPGDACKLYLAHKMESHWMMVSQHTPRLEEHKKMIDGAHGQSAQNSKDACCIHQKEPLDDQLNVDDGKGSESFKSERVLADYKTKVNSGCYSCKYNGYSSGCKKSDLQEVDVGFRSTNDVIDVDQVALCSSDDDVVCLKVTSNRRRKKRPSLSSRSTYKKQVLWYESTSNDNVSHPVIHERAMPGDQVDVDVHCVGDTSKTRASVRSCSQDTNESGLKLENVEHKEGNTSQPIEAYFNPDNKLNKTSKAGSIQTSRTLTKVNNSYKHLSDSRNNDSKKEECLKYLSIKTNCKGDVSESSTNVNSERGDDSSNAHNLDNVKPIKDEDSCFEHDFCQSQVDSKIIASKLSELKAVNSQSLSERLQSVHIHKPVDFYMSFRELVAGLNSQSQN